MPLYEYQCKKCGHRFEVIQRLSDRPLKKCPKCKKGALEKLLSSPAVHFKGTGWYVTDYARKGKDAGGEGGRSESGGESGGKDAKESKDSKDTKEKSAKSPAKKSSSKD